MQNQSIESSQKHDPLLAALVAMTKLHHKPQSAESLIAGLPLENGVLTSTLFLRAASAAGFIADYVDRSLADINHLLLPAVLELDDGQVGILIAKETDLCRIISPESPEEINEISLEALSNQYTGNCYFLKLTEEKKTALTSKDWFWDTIKKSKGIYSEVLVSSLLINLFALVTPLFIMNVYDRVVPNQAIETLWVLTSGVVVIFIFDFVMKSLRGYFIDAASKRADIMLSAQTFSRVLDIKMKDHPERVGSFANNLQEFDSFRDFFTSTTLIALIDLPFVILFLLLIYFIGDDLALVPAVAIPIILISGYLFQKPLQEVISQTFRDGAAKHAMLIEVLSALDTIKGNRAEGGMQKRWEEFNSTLAKLGLRSRFLSLVMLNLAQFLQQISTVTVVTLGVYAIADGNLSVGGLIACTILTGRCLAPMGQVTTILTKYHYSLAAFEAVDNIMHLPVERPADKKFLHRPNIDGFIQFKDVTFTYKEQKLPALDKVSFQINPGEKVGIIGRMGSGKSTLQRLLLNFYTPSSGAILIDGTDINQIDPTDLRRNISQVSQDVSLFNGSVRENIVLGSSLVDDQAVLDAARIAGILEHFNQHPKGFDLNVGERGKFLSGGQRQGIAIARAIITGSPIILLDEPTAAMDNTSEQHFKNEFASYADDKTVLLNTHKSSMLDLIDRLIVLNEGKLVADGPRQEVLDLLSGSKT